MGSVYVSFYHRGERRERERERECNAVLAET